MRVAKRLLLRIRDFADVAGEEVIGLEARDRAILSSLSEKFAGRPVGPRGPSPPPWVRTRLPPEEVHEPSLIQGGRMRGVLTVVPPPCTWRPGTTITPLSPKSCSRPVPI